MSLFGSIQLATNALGAAQIGLQTTGQNIANAQTPGYIREDVQFQPAPGQRIGNLTVGLGVQVLGVTQHLDKHLEGRLRSAISDRAGGEVQEDVFQQLEQLLGALGTNDLGTTLNDFFSSINEVLNQPESAATRNLAVLKGQAAADQISRLADRAAQLRSDLNDRISTDADRINTLLDQISNLNARVSAAETGDTSASDAVGLRDQRNLALENLSKLTSFQLEEQANGAVNLLIDGNLVVFEATNKHVEAVGKTDRGQPVNFIEIAGSQAPLDASGGEVGGLIAARDETLGGFLDQLNSFAATFINEFNKLYASGQGLKGYSALTSNNAVDNPQAALDATGLPFTPVNGSFQLLVRNKTTGLTKTTNVQVQLNGLDTDTTLNELAAQIDAADGITASVSEGRLTITSDANDQFAFANDTSGALAALGLNVFFTGFDAHSIDIDDAVKADPSKFAASRGGIAADTQGAVEMAAFLDRPLESQDDSTLALLLDRLTSNVTQGSAVSTSLADGQRAFEETLRAQHLSVSGVSIDEEAIKLIEYQRMYQASAKFIATLNDLLDALVQL